MLELVQPRKDSCSTYEDLVERKELTQVNQKARYSGQQGLQVVQDLDVFGLKGLFLLNTPLRVTRQGIGSSVYLVSLVINLELVTRELLGPAHLSRTQVLCVHKLAKFVVLGIYKHLMLRPF